MLARILTLSCVVGFAFTAAAQPLGPFQIDNKGTLMQLSLTQFEKGASSATFYFVTKEPVTNPVELYVDGPPGLSMTASISSLGSKAPAAAALESKRMFQVPLRDSQGKARQKLSNNQEVTGSSSSSSTTTTVKSGGSGSSSCLTSPEVLELVKICAAQGTPCTPQQICDALAGGGSSGGGSSSGGTPSGGITGQGSDSSGSVGIMRGLFHFHKDMCAAKGRSGAQHIAVVNVDLSGIDQSRYDSGFKINIGAKEYEWSGSRASSVKPKGHGRFPEPLILMSSVGYGDGEYFNLVKWVGGKPVKITRLPVAKYAGYRGLSLSVGRLGRSITRDRRTVELSNGGWIYSGACFSMTPARQIANGYPNVP